MEYIKHLVECKCVLQQFKHLPEPLWHSFVVFSEIDDLGNIVPSFAQCNNCLVIHRVTEVGTSTILNKESLVSLPTIEELSSEIPEKLVSTISKYDCPLTTYQELSFIFKHKLWGKIVILVKEVITENGTSITSGKYVQILGDTLWKISSFEDKRE